MKKFLAMLLILVMLLPCTLAAADGVMTDKPLSFAEFTFGDTFGNIRENIKVGSMDFMYAAYTSRCIADAIDTLPDYSNHNTNVALCFRMREEGQRTVAGYRAGTRLWFVYPDGDLTNDNGAVFYAGEYEFDTLDSGAHDIFEDIKGKLAQVYGDPFYVGSDISAVMGEAAVDDVERYNNDVEQNQAEYAVWKSSANNAVAVLKYLKQFGNWERTLLAYISDIADETMMQYANQPDAGNNSLEGL